LNQINTAPLKTWVCFAKVQRAQEKTGREGKRTPESQGTARNKDSKERKIKKRKGQAMRTSTSGAQGQSASFFQHAGVGWGELGGGKTGSKGKSAKETRGQRTQGGTHNQFKESQLDGCVAV